MKRGRHPLPYVHEAYGAAGAGAAIQAAPRALARVANSGMSQTECTATANLICGIRDATPGLSYSNPTRTAANASYLIMHFAYGSVRLSLLVWSAIVVAVFTLFYLPALVRNIRLAKAIDKNRERGMPWRASTRS